MNSFRTETFNISGTGRTESFLLQGGLRWQTISLLTNDSITIDQIGLQPSVDIQPTSELLGAFNASSDVLNGVWSLGARAVQAACVEAQSQPSTWEVTPNGTLIRGQYPAQSSKGVIFGNYTLEFSTQILQGGTGWKVADGISGGYGPYFIVTSGGPQLASTNETLLPPNTLVVGFGFTIIDQAILPSGPVRYYNLSIPIEAGEWYQITTNITATSYEITIDGNHVATVSSDVYQPYLNPGWGSNTVTDGTWSFGPYLDQIAYYKDVQVILEDGMIIYTNPMTSDEVYSEYAIASNSHAVCLDGAKRDRVIWIGDFVHTARELAASSGRYDFIQGMIDLEFEWQYPPGPIEGFVPIQAFMGADADNREIYYPSQFGEADYEHFFLLTLGDYFRLTSDTELMGKHWPGTKLLVQSLIEQYLDPTTGLLANSSAFWFTAQGTQNATAPTALFAAGLNQLAILATALDDHETSLMYSSLSANLGSSINEQLWSDELGAYAVSIEQNNITSLLAAAFTIRAGISNTTQATSSIESLSEMFYEIGYKDSTGIPNSNTTQISPNVQGFLLESLFLAHTQLNVSAATVLPVIKNLLNTYWPTMINQNKYFTGCSWEYSYPDGSPGIGIFTSLCHPWGGAPTYVLSDYVLGVRRELDTKEGVYAWVFDPVWEIVEGLGLDWVKGRVPIMGGGWIEAEWNLSSAAVANGSIHMDAKVVGNSNVHIAVKRK